MVLCHVIFPGWISCVVELPSMLLPYDLSILSLQTFARTVNISQLEISLIVCSWNSIVTCKYCQKSELYLPKLFCGYYSLIMITKI